MELQMVLIVGGVTVAVCAVWFHVVSLFGSSGTSYEEAVAEQRRATSELLTFAASNNKQALKKNKKAGKKAKEKKQKEAAQGSERESDAPVESAQEEETSAPAAPAAPQRGHVEFGESTVVDVALDKPIKHQAEKKEDFVEKKESKPLKSGKGKHGKQSAPTPAPAPATEPPVEEPASKERHNSGESKEQRKTKRIDKRQVDDTVDKVTKEEPATVAPLNQVSQPTDLTTDKILRQPLQAAVVPPPAPTPTPTHTKPKKNKKTEHNVMTLVGNDGGGVNVAELVRLVSEASLSRTEIQILTDALLNKQHGPLPQHSEWSEGPNDPVQKLKKQLAEKEKALSDEQEASQAVHAKLKELRASLNVERSRANAMSRAMEEAVSNNKVEVHTLQARMQRLLDDNHALTQEKHLLQSKLQSEGEAQNQRVQLEMHIQRLSETEVTLVSQLQALQAEVGARVLEVGQARCEAAQARDATHQVQQDMTIQLQEANRVCIELEAARASAVHAEAATTAELRAAGERIAELQAEVQRLSRANHASMQAERSLEEADRQNRQLSNEIKSLREQLAAKEEEIKKEHTNHQQNGFPPQEDTHKKAEMARLEGALEQLRTELTAAQAAGAEERKQLQALQHQLQQYRDKNNEAVAKALEQQRRETAEMLRSACPQAVPAGAHADKEWLAAFAEQLATVVRAAGGTADADYELRDQNAHLQQLVDKYKRIINDTEGVLSELQQNVTHEEQRWARLLQDKQRELDRLQQTTITQMQSKIDSLQAELERATRRPHSPHSSHPPRSLADVERGLEETNRLLTINDKHPIESLNGPSQVGLEEK